MSPVVEQVCRHRVMAWGRLCVAAVTAAIAGLDVGYDNVCELLLCFLVCDAFYTVNAQVRKFL